MTTIKIAGKEYLWSKLFTCASGEGYIPTGFFWKIWAAFKTSLIALGFEPEKQRDGSWLVLSHKVQP